MVGAMRPQLRVLTWNVQGSHDLDIRAAAAVIGAAGADVIALQEVQRRQAARLADALQVGGRCWVLKHWPIVHRAEGLAVLTPHRLRAARRFVLRRGWFWGWRRRVAVDATIDLGGRGTARVLVVHLSPHDQHHEARRREVDVIVARAARAPIVPVVVGDLNELPGDQAVGALLQLGWLDAWRERHGDEPGPTNWTAGPRAGRPATQRLDYVLAPAGSVVDDATVVAAVEGVPPAADLDAMSRLSDHLPLVVTLRLPEQP
jgi:endonuclease/exonuclease/phosphatase family metal-dependent hydrolase